VTRYRYSMIRWNLGPHMAKKGLENASQLAAGAGITPPVAYRVLRREAVERIEAATLEKLARYFRVKPWALLEYTPDE